MMSETNNLDDYGSCLLKKKKKLKGIIFSQ